MIMFVLGVIFGVVFSLLMITVQIMSNSKQQNKTDKEE